MTDKERIEVATARYTAAAHAMQSGVLMMMEHDPKATSPKHLRTGVNAAMVEHGALVNLLVGKGVFTWADYYEMLADWMELERDRYQDELSTHLKYRVTLA